MKVRIQGKQMRVPDELKRYVQDRLVEPLTRFYDDTAAELRVEFGDTNGPKGGADKECHLTLRMPGAETIQIEETTPDSYASLDAASDRLIRNAKREIERMRENGRHTKYRPLATVAAEGGVPSGPIEDLALLKQPRQPERHMRAPSAEEAAFEAEEAEAEAEAEASETMRSIGEAERVGESTEA